MKRILILIIGLIGVAYGQYSPTSAKTRFVNGLALGTKLDAYFNAADSNAIYWRADSVVMAKYKGTARALAFASALGSYKLIADTFFTGGYTTRIRTKLITDSLASVFTAADLLKKNISDTFFTTGYTTRARTKQYGDSIAATKLNLTGGVLSGSLTAVNYTASGSFVSTSSNEFLRTIPSTAGVAQFQTWFNSAGTRRGYFGFASGGSNITLENETASGDLVFRMNGATLINTATTDGASKLIVNGQASISNILSSGGVTAQRGRVTSLVVNKDSIPITTSNFWALQVDTSGTPYTNRINRRDISATHTGTIAFDTTSRTLTINQISGSTTSVVIPRGTASGASGITALSSTRTGNLVTVSGDNGSNTIFSVMDADSSNPLESLTASFGISGSPYNGTTPITWLVDTSTISTKANVTGALVAKLNISDTLGMLSNRLRISDTTTMLANRLRISDTATMLLPFVQYSDTASIVAGYVLNNRFLDSLTNVQSRIQTKQPLGAYITLADSSTILAGRWLPNRSADSISVIRALANTKLNISDTAAMLINRLKISDTANMFSPYYRTATATAALALKLNISDTATMLTPFVQYSDTANQMSGYLRKNFALLLQDTASALSNRLKISDTLSMLAPYARTANLPSIAGKLNISDTAAMLNPYLRKTDTSNMLSPYRRTTTLIQQSEVSGLSTSLAAKLNISDTAAMLSNKLRISDTLTMLSRYLRKTDTASLVLPYLRKTDTSSMLSPYARTSNLPSLTPYLLKSDSLSGGYTTWLLTKKKIDSLGALKVNYTDTASMLSNYRRSSTLILNSNLANSTISGVALGGNLNNHLNGYGISGTAYNGALTQTWSVDTSAVSTKANVTGSLVSKLNVSDTSSMLSNYRRASTQIRNADLQFFQISGISLGNNLFNLNTPYGLTGTNYNGSSPVTDWKVDTSIISTKANVTGSLVAKLNISDTLGMLSNYRRKTTLIENADLRNFRISGVQLGNNLFNLNTPYGLIGTNYNGSALVDDWKVDTGRASAKIITGGTLNKVRDSITATTVNLSGDQTIAGNKTYTGNISGPRASFGGIGLNTSPTSAGLSQTYQQLSNTNGSFYFGKESSVAGAFFTGSSAYANVIYSVGTSNQIEFIQGGAKNFSLASNGDAEFAKSVKSAGLIQPISLKTANYTLTANDHTVIFNTTSGSLTATLPVGVEGQIYVIRKSAYGSGTNDLVITPNGSQTIEGASNYTIEACSGVAVTIQFLSGNWYIINMTFIGNPC